MIGCIVTFTVTVAICAALSYLGPAAFYVVTYTVVLFISALVSARVMRGESTLLDRTMLYLTGVEYHVFGRRYVGHVVSGGYVYDAVSMGLVPLRRESYIVSVVDSSGRKYNGLYYGSIDRHTSRVIIRGCRVACPNKSTYVKRVATKADRHKLVSSIGV